MKVICLDTINCKSTEKEGNRCSHNILHRKNGSCNNNCKDSNGIHSTKPCNEPTKEIKAMLVLMELK